MSELVLYRKYRPQSFDEVVGQEHVVKPITNALKLGRVAHAYLFSGPRGVGKTTVARLIAKALNCAHANSAPPESPGSTNASTRIPCNACGFCASVNEGRFLDLVEIDAASNRGIDEIRELREGVRSVPSQGRYKVYIIDEVHQLTRDASNALLKTLEEPPAHAIFILATTELEKVPATITSRTQHYDFRRPHLREISLRLRLVAEREGVLLDGEAAHLIALAAEGSIRDAESTLGQVLALGDKKVTRGEVEKILGLPRREAAKRMFELIAKRDATEALSLVQELHGAGYDLGYFSRLLMQYFRNALFLKTDPSLGRFVESEMLPDEYECIAANLPAFTEVELSRALSVIFEHLSAFRRTPIPQLPLELALLQIIRGSKA